PYAPLMFRISMEFMNQVEGPLSIGRALHVYANEVLRLHLRRLCYQPAHVVVRKLRVDIQTHVRKFQADIGIEPARRNFSEQLTIKLSAMPRFISVVDVLAQVIDGNAKPSLIQSSRYFERILHL